MGLSESVSLLRQATTLAEVLDCLEDKKASPEATSRSEVTGSPVRERCLGLVCLPKVVTERVLRARG
jgi:hypothetical protein